MPRKNRRDVFDPRVISYNHCSVRCVRNLFLLSDENDMFRRRNIMTRRLQFLAQHFAIDVLCYAMLDNHLHLVLRNRPDVVDAWSDEQVARHWLYMFPGKHRKHSRRNDESDNNPDKQLEDGLVDFNQTILEGNAPSDEAVQELLDQPDRLMEIRERLPDISWFMRALNQYISFVFNREDEKRGSFWQERFHLQALLDEESLLACSIYVELNPIRAGIAESLAHCHFTSALERVRAHFASIQSNVGEESEICSNQPIVAGTRASFLAPLTIECDMTFDPLLNNSGNRTSNQGFLRLDLVQYLRLLEYVGAISHPQKRGKIDPRAESILDGYNINLKTLVEALDPEAGFFRRGYFVEIGKLNSTSLAS